MTDLTHDTIPERSTRGGTVDGGYRHVKIGNADCVIGHQDGADVLYCRAPAVPAQ